MKPTAYAHTGAGLWSTTITAKDGVRVFTDSESGEIIGTCPMGSDEWLVRDPHTGEAMGCVMSRPNSVVSKEHATVAINYLLAFANEEDWPMSLCVLTLMRYIQLLEQRHDTQTSGYHACPEPPQANVCVFCNDGPCTLLCEPPADEREYVRQFRDGAFDEGLEPPMRWPSDNKRCPKCGAMYDVGCECLWYVGYERLLEGAE